MKKIIFIVCLILAASVFAQAAGLNFGIISAVKNQVKALKNKKYESEGVKLSANTVVLSKSTDSSLTGVSGDTIYFNKGASEIGDLKAGQVIVSTSGTGYLKKVISVDSSSGQYAVKTGEAGIEDAFDSIHISFKKQLTSDDIDSSTIQSVQGVRLRINDIFQKRISFDILNRVIYDQDGNTNTVNDQVIVNGNVSFLATVECTIDYVKLFAKDKKVVIKISADPTAVLKLTTKKKYAISREIELFPVYFGAFTIGPLVFDVRGTIVMGVDATLTAVGETSITTSTNFTAGITYQHGVYTPIIETNPINFAYEPPSLSIDGSVKGYVGPRLTLDWYAVKLAHVQVDGYMQFNGSAAIGQTYDFNWSICGGWESSYLMQLKVFDLIDLPPISGVIFETAPDCFASGVYPPQASPTFTNTITATQTQTYITGTTPTFTPTTAGPFDETALVSVPGGTFTQTDAYTPANSFSHTISAFKMGKYQVTYDLWYTVKTWALSNGYTFANAGMEGYDGVRVSGAAPTAAKYQPVTTVNWRDTIVWCNAYSEMSSLSPVYCSDATFTTPIRTSTNNSTVNTAAGSEDNPYVNWSANGYRLPTEGEYQYAASYSGTPYNYASGATADYNDATATGLVAWYYGNSGNVTHDVGGKIANALGIYDMSGNVYEWCWDWYGTYPGTSTDYKGPASGSGRVVRGGNFDGDAGSLQVGYRGNYGPYGAGSSGGGFRFARTY